MSASSSIRAAFARQRWGGMGSSVATFRFRAHEQLEVGGFATFRFSAEMLESRRQL